MRAFTAGMAPLTLGLLLATGWILLGAHAHATAGAVALMAVTLWLMLRTRLRSPLWVDRSRAPLVGVARPELVP